MAKPSLYQLIAITKQLVRNACLVILCIYSMVSLAITDEITLTPTLFEIKLNGYSTQTVDTFYEDKSKNLYVSEETAKELNFNLNGYHAQVVHFDNKLYYSLNQFPGISYSINYSTMTVEIKAASTAFQGNNINLITPLDKPTITDGAYLNYNLNSTSNFQDNNSAANSGYFSANLFNHYGQGYSTEVVNNSLGQTTATRLLTAWQITNPATMTQWTLGDSFSSTTQWNQSVGFGGIQYGTNFNLQPNFITNPLPSVTGVATLPSTAQIYVNNNLVSTKSVNPGPFNINNIPVVNGDGSVTLVTTNIIGEQQVITVPYSTAYQVLNKGLSSYSYEAGFLRENFSVQSNDYSSFMLSGSYSEGITNQLTGQFHAEGTGDVQALGIGGYYLISNWGVLNASIGESSNQQHQLGTISQIGFNSSPILSGLSYGANLQTTTANFMDLGYLSISDTGGSIPTQQTQVYVSAPVQKGVISCSYIQQNNQGDLPDLAFLNIGYSKTLFRKWYLSINGIKTLQGPSQSQIMLTLTTNFEDTAFSASNTSNSQNSMQQLQLSKALQTAPGFGYMAQAGNTTGNNASQSVQGTLYAQNNIGTYAGGLAYGNNQSAYQLQANGAVVYADHQVVLSRPISNSFALVETKSPDVQIFANNNLYGTTNSSGNLVLPNLNSFMPNTISINPENLATNAQFNETSKSLSPYQNAGVIARFDVQPFNGGLLNVKLPSGQVIPEGASAIVLDDNTQTTYPFGSDGLLYINGLKMGTNQIHVTYGEEACAFTIDITPALVPSAANPLPQLGDYTCTPLN